MLHLINPTHRQIIVSLSVLCVLGVTLAASAAFLYRTGKSLEDDRVFLKNDRSPRGLEAEIDIKMNYVLGSNERNDVLFLGDSTCLFGLSPVQFDAATGFRSYNLGLEGLYGAKPMSLVLRRYTENHPQPRAVVACFGPNHLDGGQFDLDSYQRFLWCYGHDETTRPIHADEIRHYVRAGGRHLLGRLTGGLPARLDETVQGFKSPDATYNNFLKVFEDNRGFDQKDSRPWQWQEPFRGHRYERPFVISPDTKTEFDALAEECRVTNTALIVRIGPFYDADAPPDWSDIQAWGDEFARAHPNVTFSQPVILLYPKDWMADTHHCSAAGVKELTALVAADVRQALAKRPPR